MATEEEWLKDLLEAEEARLKVEMAKEKAAMRRSISSMVSALPPEEQRALLAPLEDGAEFGREEFEKLITDVYEHLLTLEEAELKKIEGLVCR